MAAWTPRSQNPFAVLSHPQFRLLFIGTTLAMLAFGMMQLVQGVVAYNLTGKNSAVGFVFLGQGISMLLLSPVGGALSDRVSKKRLLTGSQFIIGVMFGAIAVLLAGGWLNILLLADASLILGCMYSIMSPTRQAWVGLMMEGPVLPRGVALQQLAVNGTRIVGPLLAGAFIAVKPIGAAGTYGVMAVLFAGVVIVLALMEPTPPRPRQEHTSVRKDMAEGFAYIAHTPDVRLPAFVFVAVVLSGFSYQPLMPGYMQHVLGHPASHLGLLFGATAVGGIVVTLWLAARNLRQPATLMLLFGGAMAGSVALLAVAPGFEIALLLAALVGASSSGFQMLNNVNLIECADERYFGRVMAVTMMAFGAQSMVAYPVGALADGIGERATLAGLAAACALVVAAGLLFKRTAGRPQPATALAPEAEPA